MKQDKKTRNKLLQSAREEFMEKGYTKASLRNICRKAGVTTGALYFFFKDKSDLFESLTKDTVDAIYQMMLLHYQEESQMAVQGMIYTSDIEDINDDLDNSQRMIHEMYLHRDDLLLVLTKSQGSSMEGIQEQFVEASEVHYRMMADQMQEHYKNVIIDDNMIHWIAHMQIDAFVYMLTHIEDEKAALAYIAQAVSYMVAGWYGMFENNSNQKD